MCKKLDIKRMLMLNLHLYVGWECFLRGGL